MAVIKPGGIFPQLHLQGGMLVSSPSMTNVSANVSRGASQYAVGETCPAAALSRINSRSLSQQASTIWGRPDASLRGMLRTELALREQEKAKHPREAELSLEAPSLSRESGSLPASDSKTVLKAVGLAQRFGQCFDLAQRVTQAQRQELTLRSIFTTFESIYDRVPKRSYDKHGLSFCYAVVTSSEMPFMSDISTMGMCYDDMIFVMKDFLSGYDVDPTFMSQMMELVAVHEYGEYCFRNHHQASLLEFEVAQREGVLERYMEFLSRNYLLKFRDVVFSRMFPETREEFDECGVECDEEFEAEDDSDWSHSSSEVHAAELRDAFRWPPELADQCTDALDEDQAVVTSKVGLRALLIYNETYLNGLSQALDDVIHQGDAFDEDGMSITDVRGMNSWHEDWAYQFHVHDVHELHEFARWIAAGDEESLQQIADDGAIDEGAYLHDVLFPFIDLSAFDDLSDDLYTSETIDAMRMLAEAGHPEARAIWKIYEDEREDTW